MISFWIPISKIQPYIGIESPILLFVFLLFLYVPYRLFFNNLSARRHASLRRRFKIAAFLWGLSSFLSAAYWLLFYQLGSEVVLIKIANYLGFFCLLVLAITLIRIAQLFVFLNLFWANMSAGVPRLLVNLFTVVFSCVIFGYLANDIFGIRVTTVLTTSAIFSLVLGLALQDTLGNLFSGIAIQLDSPYAIGDWVEVRNADEKVTGQIVEITWRATFISTFSDELVMIPNKTIGQSQIVIFSKNIKSDKLCRQQLSFRFDYRIDLDRVKYLIAQATAKEALVLKDPPPRVLLTDTTESWLTVKVFYSIDDYAQKFSVADRVYSNVLETLSKENIPMTHSTLNIKLEQKS